MIYDADTAYAEHLSFYLNSQNSFPYEAMPFSDCSVLRSFLDKTENVRILSGEAAENIWPSEDTEEGGRERKGAVSGEHGAIPGRRFVRLCEEPEEDGIFRYQSCEKLMKEILEAFGRGRARQADMMQESTWTAVYSPVGRCGKTSLAIALGETLSEQYRTLYVNLESCSGFDSIFQMEEGMDLSDLIYCVRQKEELTAKRMSEAICRWKNLDYVRPVFADCDLQDVTPEEWIQFLKQLMEAGEYEAAVLDTGSIGSGVFELLARCRAIFVPTLNDPVSAAKLKQFDENISILAPAGLSDRMYRVQVPKGRASWMEGNFPEGLLRSQTGALARSLCRDVLRMHV